MAYDTNEFDIPELHEYMYSTVTGGIFIYYSQYVVLMLVSVPYEPQVFNVCLNLCINLCCMVQSISDSLSVIGETPVNDRAHYLSHIQFYYYAFVVVLLFLSVVMCAVVCSHN